MLTHECSRKHIHVCTKAFTLLHTYTRAHRPTGTHTHSYPQAHELTLNLTTYEEVLFHSHFTDDKTEAREVKSLSKVTQL